jgi:hypothetical protein
MLSPYEEWENTFNRINRNMEGSDHKNDHDQHLLRFIRYISFGTYEQSCWYCHLFPYWFFNMLYFLFYSTNYINQEAKKLSTPYHEMLYFNFKRVRWKIPINTAKFPIVQPTRFTCYLKQFILVKRSTCFVGLSVHHKELKTAYTATVYVKQLLLPAAAGNSSCLTHTFAVYAVCRSWWWTERLSETCRAFYKNK